MENNNKSTPTNTPGCCSKRERLRKSSSPKKTTTYVKDSLSYEKLQKYQAYQQELNSKYGEVLKKLDKCYNNIKQELNFDGIGGLEPRPRGANPSGMIWNSYTGEWIKFKDILKINLTNLTSNIESTIEVLNEIHLLADASDLSDEEIHKFFNVDYSKTLIVNDMTEEQNPITFKAKGKLLSYDKEKEMGMVMYTHPTQNIKFCEPWKLVDILVEYKKKTKGKEKEESSESDTSSSEESQSESDSDSESEEEAVLKTKKQKMLN